MVANTGLEPEELRRAEKGRKVGWASQQKDFDFVIAQAGRRLLFAEGDPRREKNEEPQKLITDVAALVSARDQLIALPGRVIGVAGDMSREEAEAFARDLLPAATSAPANLAPVYQAVATWRPADSVVKLPRLITNHMLGGHFYSRLYVTLRHEGGETYGARVTRDTGAQPGPLALTTFTRAENEATTEQKLRGVLDTFHASGITETELAEAKSALEGRRLAEREAPGDILGTWMWEHNRGLEHGFKEGAVKKAATLSLDDVNGFIGRYYDPTAFTMIKLEAE